MIRRGRGLRYVGHSVESYQEGDLCLLGANLPHSWSSHPESGRVESTVIQFVPEMMGKAFWDLREVRNISRLLRQAGGGFSVEKRMRHRTMERMDALEKLPSASPQRICLLLEILAGLASGQKLRPLHPASPPPLGIHSGQNEALIQKILKEVEIRSSQSIVHREMAQLARMSAPAFCRFFKRNMGKTFSDHLNDVRLARACVELADTGRSITEIAFSCGYNNLPHFNRRFRGLMKCTPREYRCRATRI